MSTLTTSEMTSSPLQDTHTITLPAILDSWPWNPRLNLFQDVCSRVSSDWIESFNTFSPSGKTTFRKCNFGLLASLFYPSHDYNGCMVGCDLMNLFFFIEEETDTFPAEIVKTRMDIIIEILHDPHKPRPEGEWVGGKAAQDFWVKTIKFATTSARNHFAIAFEDYLGGVYHEALNRSSSHHIDIDSYVVLRRRTIGTEPSYALVGLYLNLPDWVLNHPVIRRLTDIATDIIFIGNDLCSYKKEYESGEARHNLVSVVMHQLHLDVDSAFKFASDMHVRLEEQFLNEWKNIPLVAGPLSLDIITYCNGLATCIRGSLTWNFATERYFGTQGLEIQKTRQIVLNRK